MNKSSKLNEAHIMFECKFLENARRDYKFIQFAMSSGVQDPGILYKQYWKTYVNTDVLEDRILQADNIRTVYLEVVKKIHGRA